jgi:hypothetical protein
MMATRKNLHSHVGRVKPALLLIETSARVAPALQKIESILINSERVGTIERSEIVRTLT